MAGFHTVTLGCKLNQFDGAAIEGELARRGYRAMSDPSEATVHVVNTCTVTHKADADARKLIRSLHRARPDATLLVTGCYAEHDAEILDAMDEVTRVFGNRDKPRLGAILDEVGIYSLTPEAAIDRGCDNQATLPQALHFGEKSRAFLKVQDGCRLACAYCIIPQVRGASRSVPAENVKASLLQLVAAGYPEVVLTGVNTGDYGRDFDQPQTLAELLRRLLAAAPHTRLRLNSLEPLTVSDEIIELIASEPRLASHLQIPLQSGSPKVLRGMRRNYRLRHYTKVVGRLRERIPEIGLGADVIVGFPGESDDCFEESYEYIAASPLNYLHVFSWSPRPGTDAADYPDRVSPAVQRERSARLRTLADELGFKFRERFVRHEMEAVTLGERRDGRGQRALTSNFIEVTLPSGSAPSGSSVIVQIESVEREKTVATLVGRPDWAE